MKKLTINIVVLVILSTLLSGCWSRIELNDLAIATSIGIDKAEEQYVVSVQVVNPSEVASKASGGGYQTPVTVYTTKSSTMLGAIRKLTTISPRKIYKSHLRTLIFSEEVAKEGLAPLLDFFARDRDVREEDLFVLIARGGSANEVLKVLTHLDKIPAMKMYGALQTLEKNWAPIPVVKLSEVTSLLAEGEQSPVIPAIIVEGDKSAINSTKAVQSVEPSAYLHFVDTAAFKKDKLVGWLNENESRGFNYITNRVNKTAGEIKCPSGGYITLDTIRTDTKVKGKVKNGMPEIDITVRVEGNIADVQCNIDLTDTKVIDELEVIANESMVKVLQSTVDKVQKELKTDIFGFGNVIHRANRKEWAKIKDDWEEIFPEVPVNIKVNGFIRSVGTEDGSFYEMEGMK